MEVRGQVEVHRYLKNQGRKGGARRGSGFSKLLGHRATLPCSLALFTDNHWPGLFCDLLLRERAVRGGEGMRGMRVDLEDQEDA